MFETKTATPIQPKEFLVHVKFQKIRFLDGLIVNKILKKILIDDALYFCPFSLCNGLDGVGSADFTNKWLYNYFP